MLEGALWTTEQVIGSHVDRLRDASDVAPGIHSHIHDLRMSVALIGVLRRLVRGKSLKEIHNAFGAPGDWGYETVLGDALSRIYRGEANP
jgi:hypothetical protein